MPTFRRNMLSPFQGWSDKAGKKAYIGSEEQRLRERSQSERRNRTEGSFPHIPSLWLAPFPQPSLLRCYISPVLTYLVTSALKMETACFSEMLASTYETTRRQNPRQHQYHPLKCSNHEEKVFSFHIVNKFNSSQSDVFSLDCRKCSRNPSLS
jgi:hypothetical protein